VAAGDRVMLCGAGFSGCGAVGVCPKATPELARNAAAISIFIIVELPGLCPNTNAVRPCEFLEPVTSTSNTIFYLEPPSRSLALHAALGRNLVAQFSIVFSRHRLIERESVVSVVITFCSAVAGRL
jgi:hypothetical protein